MKKVITFSAMFGMLLTVLFWFGFQTHDGLLASQDDLVETTVDSSVDQDAFASGVEVSEELPAPPPPLAEEPSRFNGNSGRLSKGTERPVGTEVPIPDSASLDEFGLADEPERMPLPDPEPTGAFDEPVELPVRNIPAPSAFERNSTYSAESDLRATNPGHRSNASVAGTVLNDPRSTTATNGPRNRALATVRGLRQALASGRGNRKKIETDLRQALSDYFLADMQSRNAQLEQIRKRVESMEQKLQRRMKSHDEVVELQLKLLIHEADGLGFFAPGDELNTKALAPQNTFDNPFGSDGLNRHASPNKVPLNKPVLQNSPIFPDDEPLGVPVDRLDSFGG